MSPDAMNPSTSPLVCPTLPLLPVAGLLVAVLPAWLAPASAGRPRAVPR